MKELYRSGVYHIAIMNENNYVLYDNRTLKVLKKGGKMTESYKYKYYSQLWQAIREMARLIANDEATDLKSWSDSLRNTLDTFRNLLETTEEG